MAMARLGKQVVELKNVTVRLRRQARAPCWTTSDWIIGPGDRYGIVGANGVGKTTLLKVIQGKAKPQTGFVKIGKTVKFAVLSQHLGQPYALRQRPCAPGHQQLHAPHDA